MCIRDRVWVCGASAGVAAVHGDLDPLGQPDLHRRGDAGAGAAPRRARGPDVRRGTRAARAARRRAIAGPGRARRIPASRSHRGRREPQAPRAPVSAGGVQDWFSPERLEACQRAIHYHFRDVSLLENALTHSSIKAHDRPSYERMEFLGDSVIGLVIAEYLYNLLPDCDEGELTKVKSCLLYTSPSPRD